MKSYIAKSGIHGAVFESFAKKKFDKKEAVHIEGFAIMAGVFKWNSSTFNLKAGDEFYSKDREMSIVTRTYVKKFIEAKCKYKTIAELNNEIAAEKGISVGKVIENFKRF
jgi:hypothetical protein